MNLALFLLAGRGSRIKAFSDKIPKCLIEINGRPILHTMLDKLEARGVARTILVTGYLGDIIFESVGPSWKNMAIEYLENKAWESTNNIVSLFLANNKLSEDFYLFEGDILISDRAFDLLKGKPNIMAVSRWEEHLDGTMVELDGDNVEKFWLKKDLSDKQDITGMYKTVNIYGINNNEYQALVYPEMKRIIKSGETGIYYEKAFANLVNAGKLSFKAVDFSSEKWAEVDTESDLAYARQVFES